MARCDPWEVLKPKDAPGYTYDSLKNRMVPLNFYRSRLDRCAKSGCYSLLDDCPAC